MGKKAKPAAATAKRRGGASSLLFAGGAAAAVFAAAAVAWFMQTTPEAVPESPVSRKSAAVTDERPPAAKKTAAAEERPAAAKRTAAEEAAMGKRIETDPSFIKNYEKPAKVTSDQPPPEPGCGDSNEQCVNWANAGECDANPGFMTTSCKWSCGLCKGGTPPKKKASCADTNRMCATWASIGECESNPGFMKVQCPVTCRMCQSENCFDVRPDCKERVRGGPESNYSATGCYTDLALRDQCMWTCVACGVQSQPRCKRKLPPEPAATPGSTQRMFERVAAHPGARVWSRDPWVVTIDDFLTAEEADTILRVGGQKGTGWSRSLAGDGVQTARTSSTSWCKGACLDDPTVVAVQDRVAALTQVPVENSEYMQMLEYQVGQYYKVHHDQNSPRSSAWGPRMYTFFLYLAEEYTGGETSFPRLNITIPPKKGSALVWPSILDSDPYERDDRTDHEALPVASGTKYAANYWLHMYRYRGLDGCDNQAYSDNWY